MKLPPKLENKLKYGGIHYCECVGYYFAEENRSISK